MVSYFRSLVAPGKQGPADWALKYHRNIVLKEVCRTIYDLGFVFVICCLTNCVSTGCHGLISSSDFVGHSVLPFRGVCVCVSCCWLGGRCPARLPHNYRGDDIMLHPLLERKSS